MEEEKRRNLGEEKIGRNSLKFLSGVIGSGLELTYRDAVRCIPTLSSLHFSRSLFPILSPLSQSLSRSFLLILAAGKYRIDSSEEFNLDHYWRVCCRYLFFSPLLSFFFTSSFLFQILVLSLISF